MCVRFGMWNVREVWNTECEGLGYAAVTGGSGQRIGDVQVRFSGNIGRHTRKGKTEWGAVFSVKRETKIINHNSTFCT
jgi:hypothetical protein